MVRSLKKQMAFGAVFSLTLLVGSFQAASNGKPGIFASMTQSRLVQNPLVQNSVAPYVAAAGLASTTETLINRFKGQETSHSCPFAGYEYDTQNVVSTIAVRAGYFTVGVETPTVVATVSTDNEGKTVHGTRPTSLLERVQSIQPHLKGFTLGNVAKTLFAYKAMVYLTGKLNL